MGLPMDSGRGFAGYGVLSFVVAHSGIVSHSDEMFRRSQTGAKCLIPLTSRSYYCARAGGSYAVDISRISNIRIDIRSLMY